MSELTAGRELDAVRPMTAKSPNILSVPEVAAILGRGEYAVRKALRAREIPGYAKGNHEYKH